MLPSVFNRLGKVWGIDYPAKMPSPDCYRGKQKMSICLGLVIELCSWFKWIFPLLWFLFLLLFTWDWMRNYAFMKIGICIPPHFFSFLSPKKVKLKFSNLQLKTTTVQPENKEIKQQTETRRSYFLTSSQDPIFPSQGCLDRAGIPSSHGYCKRKHQQIRALGCEKQELQPMCWFMPDQGCLPSL